MTNNGFGTPVRARDVFRALPVTLMPLDATNHVAVAQSYVDRIGAAAVSPSARIVHAIMTQPLMREGIAQGCSTRGTNWRRTGHLRRLTAASGVPRRSRAVRADFPGRARPLAGDAGLVAVQAVDVATDDGDGRDDRGPHLVLRCGL